MAADPQEPTTKKPDATTFTVETSMEIETGSKTQTKVIILVILLVITFVVIVGGVAVGTMILCKYEPKIS